MVDNESSKNIDEATETAPEQEQVPEKQEEPAKSTKAFKRTVVSSKRRLPRGAE